MKERNMNGTVPMQRKFRQKKSSRQKAQARERLQLMYPHRKWVYNVNGHKTSL